MDLKELQDIIDKMEKKHASETELETRDRQSEYQQEEAEDGTTMKQTNAEVEGKVNEEKEKEEMRSIDESLVMTEQMLTRFETEMKAFHVRMDELNNIMNEEDFQKFSERTK
ncbi:hypothetical protein SPOG_04542 [Schizosaccharomyces cryophilus OY26]|uniref:Uncharacterized protein n=1 Tax=Schizosaccharomyces cryophilus (strain OY26 / ATCC MYA-4695 / CBS 11777 / NBRC 106824 / NRRL Y48691) TaxID=653667 RepID=S9XIG9_SCHCR|nr:uncharacterized protein SPOG_04542 [Schizosaccharomyces cryophilus OY26]EPY53456.1 hypothetical protein SPOG_04542 [Schizosaccharomyces cryophilus OY26]